MSANIAVAALSDIGCVRKNNEDNFALDRARDLYVVCDGMGGMAAGEVASLLACNTFLSTFSAQPIETSVEMRLSAAITAANHAVVKSGELPEQRGMGTTLVSAALDGGKLLIANVGDSRAYLLQNGSCMQLTVDHSYLNELIRIGSIKLEHAHLVDLRGMESVITRAIGAAADVDPDFFSLDLMAGDVILLASDGLTRYLDKDRIAELIDPANLEASCTELIETAKQLGGIDNITVLLLRYDPAPEAPQPALAPPQ